MKVEEPRSAKELASELSPCIATGAERTKFEQFKASSEYLKVPLEQELGNACNHFTNDAVQLLKFHGSYQQDNREKRKKGEEKDWQLMLRLRSPGGKIPTKLYLALDSLSDKLGNGTLRATTRQAFQMHGIRKDNLQEVINTIIKSMGSTLAACGDINRNVMAPAAPFDKENYKVARNLSTEIADLLSPKQAEKTYLDLWVDGDLSYRIRPNPNVVRARKKQEKSDIFSGDIGEPLYGNTYMPRKFKCAVTVPGDNSIDLLTHDIGLVVFTNQKGALRGCNVYVGGGMGRTHNNDETFARIAEPLGYVSAEHILELIQSILAIQRDYGDRKVRRHARMKYLIKDHGIAWLKERLYKNYFPHKIEKYKPEPKRKLKDYLGWHKQSKRMWFVGLPLLSGRISGDFKKSLRKLIETYQLDIRLTPNQDLLICNIGSHQKRGVQDFLSKFNLQKPELIDPIKRHAIACPALPLCGLAITEAERMLPEILERIQNQLDKLKIDKTILIRITGCPNGCARPYMAELALVGSGINQYQLWLGGSPNLERLAKPYLSKMSLEKLEQTLNPALKGWRETGLKMSFGDYINQLDDQTIQSLLKAGE